MRADLLRSRYPAAHPDYTTLYDQVIAAPSGTVTAIYGSVVAVTGASVTVDAPVVPTALPPTVKDAFHFGVVNVLGVAGLTISGAGNNINDAASISLPAFPGAFAAVWWSTKLGQWVAYVSAGGEAGAPPSYTARGPTADQTFNNSALVAVNQASITTANFTATQKAIIEYTVEVHNGTAGAAAQANLALFDGIATNFIDPVRFQSLDISATEATDFQIVTLTTEVQGNNGGPRTFGMSIVANDSENVVVRAQTCRGVVQIVDG